MSEKYIVEVTILIFNHFTVFCLEKIGVFLLVEGSFYMFNVLRQPRAICDSLHNSHSSMNS